MGILGGTFNPPHRAHVALAAHARRELGLDLVLLMPAHIAPYKLARELAREDPGPEHRLHMCELAVEGVAGVRTCALELARAAPSYTVDTLSEIHASHPEACLTFILGSDTACTLASWREPERVLQLSRLAIAARSGAPRARVLEVLESLHAGASGRAVFLEMPAIEISSSQVRARVARGQPVEELVGAQVASYIAREQLYTSAGGARA